MDREIIIGNRVKLINPSYDTKKDYPSLLKGDEGIVVNIFSEIKLDPKDGEWKDFRKNYCIDWNKSVNGHDCDGRCENGHGCCVKRDEIEVI
jgi:hypothetical protein